MTNDNDKTYTWSFSDVRTLDNRLTKIDSNIEQIKNELNTKNHLVIDNSYKTDWKAVGAIAIAVIGALGTLYITIKGAL